MNKFGILRKRFVVGIALTIVIGGLYLPVMKSTVDVKANDAVQAVGINVAYHTEEEVREYLKSSGAKPGDAVVYKEKPSFTEPYKAGSLSDETLNSALKMLNQVRYIAGISYNVSLDDDFIVKSQAASLVNKINGELSHYPTKPSNMEEGLYQLGAAGASRSNLGYGYSTINRSIVYGYMEDGDSSNIDRVGHRRWILNPKMSITGFGYCENFTALYATDGNNSAASEYGVAWPAQTMPTDYFGTYYPWSISFDYQINQDSVQVNLVRLSDQRTWNFSKSSADGYFNVNNGGYGQTGCIIFRPDDIEGYVDGDKFQVTITGLNTPVSYQVSFFDLVPVTSITIKKTFTKLAKGDEIYLTPIIAPSNATNRDITWSSSDDTILEVSEYGDVIAKNYGTATITATSIGSGVSANYKINVVPDSISISNLSSKKKGQITVTYDKDKTVSGYEIVYATNEKFSKNKKTVTVSKSTTSKVTLSGLKAGKTYYVKVRSYVLINDKKVYGAYGFWDYIRVKE